MSGSDLPTFDLFRTEVEMRTGVLSKGLPEVEAGQTPERIEPLVQAVHSIKAAARIVGLDLMVSLAGAMEDVLFAARQGKLTITASHVDLLLLGNDILSSLAWMEASEIPLWVEKQKEMIEGLCSALMNGRADDQARLSQGAGGA